MLNAETATEVMLLPESPRIVTLKFLIGLTGFKNNHTPCNLYSHFFIILITPFRGTDNSNLSKNAIKIA